MTEYLHQTDGTCCGLYALCNALRYFGRTTPEPDTPEWESLVGKPIDEVAAHLGLQAHRVDPQNVSRHLPAMLIVKAPTRHIALVTGAENGHLTLVNYRIDGPEVEDVSLSNLKTPAPPLAGAWALSLV